MPINLAVIDTFDFHQAPVYAVTHNHIHLYSAGGDRKIIRYAKQGVQFVAELFAQTTGSTFALHLEDNILLSGGIDGNLNVFEVSKKQILHRFQCHEKGIYAIEANQEFIITGGGDGKIHLWDKSSYTIIRTIWTGEAKLRKFIWNNDKTRLACIDNAGYCRVFETKFWNEIHTIQHQNGLTCGIYHPSKNIWMLGSKLGELLIFDEAFQTKLLQMQSHLNAIYDLKWIADVDIIATCSLDKSIKFWDGKTLELLLKTDKINGSNLRSINAMALWDNHLIIAGDDKKIHVTKICFLK